MSERHERTFTGGSMRRRERIYQLGRDLRDAPEHEKEAVRQALLAEARASSGYLQQEATGRILGAITPRQRRGKASS